MNEPKHVFYLGIGGIGMSALARYHRACGWNVAGYDKTPSSMTESLQLEGIEVVFEDSVAAIPNGFEKENTLIIFTPAVPKNSNLLQHFSNPAFRMIKRAQALGEITQNSTLLAIGGTHGKTTTSCLVSQLLGAQGISFTAFLGGIASNFGTNYIAGNPNLVVVEADEFDRSFLHLHPSHAVITSTDADHLDIYGDQESVVASFQEFASLVPQEGKVWLFDDAQKMNGANIFTYGNAGDAQAKNIRIENGKFTFDFEMGEISWKNLNLGIPGFHNVWNATAALAILLGANLPIHENEMRKGLSQFQGVARRFDQRFANEQVVYIDDYAHHPTEIDSLISSVRALYPNKKITGIFQPHLYSRTRDFMSGFAESLAHLDRLILMDIYPARELPIAGITSEKLLDRVELTEKSLATKDEVVGMLHHSDEVILTIGAGDIDRLVPMIEEKLRGGWL
ncbi:MAG: UDP-N-acetylmuramate--L-alanine ligase [Bacteroidia bacterium]